MTKRKKKERKPARTTIKKKIVRASKSKRKLERRPTTPRMNPNLERLLSNKHPKRRRPKKAKQVVKGRIVRHRKPKSLDELIIWKPHFDEGNVDHVERYHETFDPVVVPLRLLPRPIREHYTFKEIDLECAMAYPGKKRQIYGKPIQPHVYFVVTRKDGAPKEAWAELPHPSLKGEKPYWQRDYSVKFYRPWQF